MSSALAFPLNTLDLSAALRADAFSQSVAILFEMNGQSTENMMRSMPISVIDAVRAVSEKLPLVVT